MRKSSLFIAAGAAVFLCGCPTTKVTGTKTVIPAPMDDPAPMVENNSTMNKGTGTWEAPQAEKNQKTVKTPAFEPMTGVVSSGGIDSPVSGKRGKKNAVKGGKTATAGGVYIVQSGDTPERIARKHRVRLSAFMAVNNLDQQSARRLQIGQKLVIPGKDAKIAPAKGKKSSVAKAAAAASVDADGKYTVQSGDTPERIARKYRVRLSELLKANNLDQQSARRLQIGQKLVIPGKSAAPAAEPAKAPETVIPVAPAVSDVPVTSTDTPVSAETTPVVSESTTTAVTETVTTTPTDGGDADSEIQMVTIDADTTAAELAVKYNVSADSISQKNSGKTEFLKGDIIFIPKK